MNDEEKLNEFVKKAEEQLDKGTLPLGYGTFGSIARGIGYAILAVATAIKGKNKED